MPTLKSAELEMHYEVDDFTDPWTKPETILLLHGNSESGVAWWGWVPHLAQHYRVVRPDMRGFGQSTPMPREFPWTLDVIIDDYIRLMDALGIKRFHLVGAKIGGTIARAAARRADRVLTLTVVGTPPPFREVTKERLSELTRDFAENGVEPWARRTMAGRLGSAFPPEGVEWWTKFMGRTDRNTQVGFMKSIAYADIGRPPENPLPDARHDHRGKRARFRRSNPGVAAADPQFEADRHTRKLLPRGGERRRKMRAGDARFHRNERRDGVLKALA